MYYLWQDLKSHYLHSDNSSHCCPNVFVQVLGNCLITHIKSAIMGCSDLKCKNQFQMIFVPINTVGGKYHEYRKTGFLSGHGPPSMAYLPQMREPL